MDIPKWFLIDSLFTKIIFGKTMTKCINDFFKNKKRIQDLNKNSTYCNVFFTNQEMNYFL